MLNVLSPVLQTPMSALKRLSAKGYNYNVSKNAVYKVINKKRRKLLLCILRFISYRFMVFRYKTDA